MIYVDFSHKGEMRKKIHIKGRVTVCKRVFNAENMVVAVWCFSKMKRPNKIRTLLSMRPTSSGLKQKTHTHTISLVSGLVRHLTMKASPGASFSPLCSEMGCVCFYRASIDRSKGN